MKKFIFFIQLIVLLSNCMNAQSRYWQWGRSAAGISGESANAITTDKNGNVIVCGYFYSPTLIFGNDTLLNQGNYDIFFTKYDSIGNLIWAKSGGGAYDEVALGIDCDTAGNIYVTGYLYSPTISVGTQTVGNNGIGDIFVLKYDASGNVNWLKNFGGNDEDNATAIACDKQGNVFVTGFFQSNTLPVGSTTLINTGNADAFIFSLNSSGQPLWANSFEGTRDDRGNGIGCDLAGNVLVTGYFFSSSFVLGGDTVICNGSSDCFAAKFSGNGTPLWLRSIGGSFNESGANLTTDYAGNVTIVGSVLSPSLAAGNSTITNKGNFDVFILKYDALGTVIWARDEGDIFDEHAYGIKADDDGNIFLAGHFHSPQIILGADTLINTGIGDFYIAKYNPAGNILWTEKVGGLSDEGANSISVDPFGNILVSGFFISSTLTCPGFTLNNTGNTDLFTGKLKIIKPNTTGQKEELSDMSVTMFPNPAKETATISSLTYVINNIKMYDHLGRLVCERNCNSRSEVVDIIGLPRGLYLVKIQIEDSYFHKKLIIE